MVQRLLSPHFKIRKIIDVSHEDIYSLCDCIGEYIVRSEPGTRLDQILSQIHYTVDNGSVWFLYQDKEVVGFLTANILKSIYGEVVCLVDYWFVKNEPTLKGQAQKLAEIGIAWVKQIGVKKILFVTHRDPWAMCKVLPGNWQPTSTILELKICA